MKFSTQTISSTWHLRRDSIRYREVDGESLVAVPEHWSIFSLSVILSLQHLLCTI